MLAARRRYLHYSKVYSDVTKRGLLAWKQNKQITYYIYIYIYIFYIVIPNSVLTFLTIAQICYQQISIIRCYCLNNQSELGS